MRQAEPVMVKRLHSSNVLADQVHAGGSGLQNGSGSQLSFDRATSSWNIAVRMLVAMSSAIGG